MYGQFEQFKTDGVDMAKLDQLIMQKKQMFSSTGKKGLKVNIAGLMFTEAESISGWMNRSAKDIN